MSEPEPETETDDFERRLGALARESEVRAATLARLGREVKAMRAEHIRCRVILDHLYERMVTFVDKDEFNPENVHATGVVLILHPSGKIHQYGDINRHDAEIHWRRAWGLDQL